MATLKKSKEKISPIPFSFSKESNPFQALELEDIEINLENQSSPLLTPIPLPILP